MQIAGPGGRTHSATADDEGAFHVTLDLFKQGGGAATEEFGIPFLGALPFDPGFVEVVTITFIASSATLKAPHPSLLPTWLPRSRLKLANPVGRLGNRLRGLS